MDYVVALIDAQSNRLVAKPDKLVKRVRFCPEDYVDLHIHNILLRIAQICLHLLSEVLYVVPTEKGILYLL